MNRENRKKGSNPKEDKINEDIYLFDLSTAYHIDKVDNIGYNKVLIFSKILEIFKNTINMIIDNKNENIKNENNTILIYGNDFNSILNSKRDDKDSNINNIYENLSDKDIIYILFFDIINNITVKFNKNKDNMGNKNPFFIDFIKYLNKYIVPKINFLINYLETNEGTIKDFIEINDDFYNTLKTPDDKLIEKINDNKKKIEDLCKKINEINDKYNAEDKNKISETVKEFNKTQNILLEKIKIKNLIDGNEKSNLNINVNYGKFKELCTNIINNKIYKFENDIAKLYKEFNLIFKNINIIKSLKEENISHFDNINNKNETFITYNDNCEYNNVIIINIIDNIIDNINNYYSILIKDNDNIFFYYYKEYIENSKKYMKKEYMPNDKQLRNNNIKSYNDNINEFKKILYNNNTKTGDNYSKSIKKYNDEINIFNNKIKNYFSKIKKNIKLIPNNVINDDGSYDLKDFNIIDNDIKENILKKL